MVSSDFPLFYEMSFSILKYATKYPNSFTLNGVDFDQWVQVFSGRWAIVKISIKIF